MGSVYYSVASMMYFTNRSKVRIQVSFSADYAVHRSRRTESGGPEPDHSEPDDRSRRLPEPELWPILPGYGPDLEFVQVQQNSGSTSVDKLQSHIV